MTVDSRLLRMPLSSLVGHHRVVGLLERSIARGALPQSLLFAGPSGVGKRLAAIAVAQAVNCLEPVGVEPEQFDACGTCNACTRIARGVHPDVILIEPGDTGSIKIEQVRDAIDRTA